MISADSSASRSPSSICAACRPVSCVSRPSHPPRISTNVPMRPSCSGTASRNGTDARHVRTVRTSSSDSTRRRHRPRIPPRSYRIWTSTGRPLVHALPGYVPVSLLRYVVRHLFRIPSGIEHEKGPSRRSSMISSTIFTNGIGCVSAVHGRIHRYVYRISELRCAEVHLTEVGALIARVSEIVRSRSFSVHCRGRGIDVHIRIPDRTWRTTPAEVRQHLRHDLPAAFHRTVDRTVAHLAADARFVPHFGRSEPSSAPFHGEVLREAVRDDRTHKLKKRVALGVVEKVIEARFRQIFPDADYVPIGTDLLVFGSRTNVPGRNSFVFTDEPICSGHLSLATSI